MTDNRRVERDRLQGYRKSVRIFGIRKGKFLEFDFTVGCAELTIELVMPYDAFREFCETNHVAEISCDMGVRTEFARLAAIGMPKIYDNGNIIQLGEFK